MAAHMAVVKEQLRSQPKLGFWDTPVSPRLEDGSVEVISYDTAAALIGRYEWLDHKMGTSELAIGLYLDGHLAGALSFGRTAGSGAKAILDDPKDGEVMVLARGATEFWAPPNAASFLIGRALKMLKQGVTVHRPWADRVDTIKPHVVVAYADERAGEYGFVYQASNWWYTGTTAPVNVLKDPSGRIRDSRLISKYAKKRGISYAVQLAEFRLNGYTLEPGYPKHRYIYLLNKRERKRLRVQHQAYPKPLRGGSNG